VGAFQFQDVTLGVAVSAASTVNLGTTEKITVTVTNTSNNSLPADNGVLVLTTSSGLNLGGAQTRVLGALAAGKSVSFTFNATATALGMQTITATVTTPDTNPLTVSKSATVTVTQPTLMSPPSPTPVGSLPPSPAPSPAPAGGLTPFAFGLGPTGLDLFEVDSTGEVFAVPFMGGSPVFLNSALELPLARIQDGQLLAQLAGSNGQDYVVDIFSPLSPFVESAVLAALLHI
jgi:hypothetical protein